MSRPRLTFLAGGLLVLGALAEWAALQRTSLEAAVGGADVRAATMDFIAGASLGAAGLAAWTRAPRNRTGPLLTAASAAWFVGTLGDSGLSGIAAVGSAVVTLHRGPLMHALVAYPDGRSRGRFEGSAIAAAWISALIAPLGENAVVAALVCTLLLTAIAARFTHEGARERLAVRRSLITAALLSVTLIAATTGGTGLNDRVVLVAYEFVVAGGALWLAAGVVHPRWTEATVASLVIRLGGGAEGSLEARVADALDDPSLQLGYRVAGFDGFVDADGRTVSLAPDPGRRITYLGAEEPIAVLVHDQTAIQDPVLLESVAAAARIAVSNVQLQAAVRDRVAELAASRRRIVEAADAQRRRFGLELRRGAEAKLAEVDRALQSCCKGESTAFDEALTETLSELTRARAELNEFARGVRPPLLTDAGLGTAVAELVRTARLPVTVVACSDRFAPAIEAVAYFVCAEALANAGKYAHAGTAAIGLQRADGQLLVSVVDDGAGGAAMDAGSGLVGLRDRVEALGGRLTVQSPPGHGTRIEAALPLT